jgi:hypothetical protein
MLGIAGDGGVFVLPASAACVQVLSCRAELSRGLDDEVTASSPKLYRLLSVSKGVGMVK